MIQSIDDSLAFPLPARNFAPLEWSDADEAFPFEVPEWENLGMARVSPRVMSRHHLFLGDTGSGKTKSGIKPVLAAALRYRSEDVLHRAAVLVIDPKFELAPVIEELLSGQERAVTTLAVAGPERRIGLFEGVHDRYGDPADAVAYTLANCCEAYVSQGRARDQFWRVSGRQIIEALVAADTACLKRCGMSIWSVLLSESNEDDRDGLRASGVSTRPGNYYANAYAFCSAALNRHRLLLRFADICDAQKLPRFHTSMLRGLYGAPDGQRGSQLSMAMQFLGELANRELNEAVDLCPPGTGVEKGQLSIRAVVENGDVLLFSPGLGAGMHDTVGRIVKTKFFEASFARRNKERAVFYICDEFQRFITGDPQSGEQSFLDRCRAYRVVCALATQSMASLSYGLQQAQVGGEDLRASLGILMNNTGNKLFFRNTDQETQECLEKLFPRSPDPRDPSLLGLRPVSSLAVGECYYLFSDGRMGRGRVRLPGTEQSDVDPLLDVPVVRLSGAMTLELVLSVCDTIERLVRFQRATEINIEIDSPGGSSGTLQYLVGKMTAWRAGGVRFHTTALLSAASAAALVLALGDHGCRRAHRFSRIMFHNGRYIPSQPVPITKEVAQRLIDDLMEGDHFIEKMVVDHLYRESGHVQPARMVAFDQPPLKELNLGISKRTTLDRPLFLQIYRTLAPQDRFITAQQALLLGFVDWIV